MKKYYSLSTGLFINLEDRKNFVVVVEDDEAYSLYENGETGLIFISVEQIEEAVKTGFYQEIENPFDK